MSDITDLRGRWVLITGASRGIGKLAAACMAEHGCNLILHSRDLSHTKALEKELSANGVEVRSVAADLADQDSVQKMLQDIDAMKVPVDVVLNNAGLQVAYRTEYLKTPASDFTTSFSVNTISPIMICYHFLPGMIERGFGRIVNTTSGIRLEPQQAGYSASKAALDKVTIDLGSTLQGSNVTINLTDPGWCRTDLGGPKAPNDPKSAIPGYVVGAFINDHKSGRLMPAQDFAGMTLEDAVAKAEREYESPYGN